VKVAARGANSLDAMTAVVAKIAWTGWDEWKPQRIWDHNVKLRLLNKQAAIGVTRKLNVCCEAVLPRGHDGSPTVWKRWRLGVSYPGATAKGIWLLPRLHLKYGCARLSLFLMHQIPPFRL